MNKDGNGLFIKVEDRLNKKDSSFKIDHTFNDSEWQPILTCSLDSKPDYGFVGGACYTKNGDVFSLQKLENISFSPWYCYFRMYPQRFEGRWLHSCLYFNMPIFCVQSENHAYGLSFNPILNVDGKSIPLAFSFYSKDSKTFFELGLYNNFKVFRKKDSDYIDWNNSKLKFSRVLSNNLKDKETELSFSEYIGGDWREVLHSYLSRQIKTRTKQEVDAEFHLKKSLNWLYSIYNPKFNVFTEWKLRRKRGFKNGFFSMFGYNTLSSDLFLLGKKTKNQKTKEMSKGAKDLLLDEDASVMLESGRVWHNGLSLHLKLDLPLKKLAFFTHFGTGVGGFPGGQATVSRSLLERMSYGDDDRKLADRAKEGADWMLNNLGEGGSWNRTYYYFNDQAPRKIEAGKGSYSVGGNAEGALALMLAYELFKDERYMEKGLEALRWVNEFRENGVITSGYLRDASQEETDGVSAIFAVFANLRAHEITKNKEYLNAAVDFGYYLTTWQRWWDEDYPSFDTLVFSFTPRIAPCETSWAAEAYLDLYKATSDEFWLDLSKLAFNPVNMENDYEGYSEAVYYDEELGLHPHEFECVYTASAVLRYAIKYLDLHGEPLPDFDISSKPCYKEALSYKELASQVLNSYKKRARRQ